MQDRSGRMQLINQMNQNKPPSSGSNFQMLRESREKERHENLANISKQIVSPGQDSRILHSSDQNNSRFGNIQKPPLNDGQYSGHGRIGLPPSGSPNKRKMSNQGGYSGKQQAIPKQPVKPPSNYSRGSRHMSQNKIAPNRANPLPGIDKARMSRDRSSDGLINTP